MNKEFLEFMTGKESVPEHLKSLAKKDILLSFHAKSIIAKFLGYQLLGALFSMSVCPQFGLGLVEGHGITHVVRMIGDWACAAFCGSLFLSAGLMVAFIGMKGEELWWIWNRYKFSLIFLPALLWGGLMLTNISLNLDGESILYHVMWIASAIFAQWVLLKMRSQMFLATSFVGNR
ncbi:hypothetical protein ACJVC5_15870 [Peredibacter sp. HCB2-198]|uniref:hypothetical protein n=1 Tax=Peredibacter sp. HCB2-198 TaxID=3383025 RepID=UPI0038B5B875